MIHNGCDEPCKCNEPDDPHRTGICLACLGCLVEACFNRKRVTMNYMVQKRPYREPDAWYWIIVDRRNGLSTMKRYPTKETAQMVCDELNGIVVPK